MRKTLGAFSASAVAATLALTVHAQTIEPLHFHHVHLNSVDPKAAAAYYPKPFAQTAVATTLSIILWGAFVLFREPAQRPEQRATISSGFNL